MALPPPDSTKALRLRTAGLVVVIVGGLVFVGVLALLHWHEGLVRVPIAHHFLGRSGGPTSAGPREPAEFRGRFVVRGTRIWDYRGNGATALTVIAAVTVALAAAGLPSDSVAAAVPAVCGSFYLLGQVFPWNVAFYYGLYELGFWLATAAALAMAVGGVLAVVAAARFADRAAKRSRAATLGREPAL